MLDSKKTSNMPNDQLLILNTLNSNDDGKKGDNGSSLFQSQQGQNIKPQMQDPKVPLRNI